MSDPIVRLVEKSDNCKHWSGIDAVTDAMHCMISAERTVKQAIVLWYEEDEHGNRKCCYRVAGVSRAEHVAMLAIFSAMAIDNFAGK